MSILRQRGFIPYLMMAFLNASVDLAHKITMQNILLKSFSGHLLLGLSAVVNAMILLPFIFLFLPAAFCSDCFSRTRIIRLSAGAACIISVLLAFCYYRGYFEMAFMLTLLLAIQSAFYSPAKYSLIKSMVGESQLGAANGWIQAVTMIAILSSSFVFSYFFEKHYSASENTHLILQSVWPIGLVLVLFSALECFFAYRIPFYPQESKQESFRLQSCFSWRDLKQTLSLLRQGRMASCVWGLSLFWGISQLLIAAFPAHYKAVFAKDNALIIQAILLCSGLGLMVGSFVAGRMSRRQINLSSVMLGAWGLSFSLLALALLRQEALLMLFSFLFGLAGGLFVVPLNAIIQYDAPEEEGGKIMAGNNFMQNILMLSFLFLSLLFVLFQWSITALFICAACLCFMACLWALMQWPHLFIQSFILPLLKMHYRFRIEGLKNMPAKGGVLLLGNHVSWMDWLILQAASPRPIRFVMYRAIYNKWYLKCFMRFFGAVPIGGGGSLESVETIKHLLKQGEAVALFPEGHLSYNGQINVFQRGFEHIIKDESFCVLPFYLHGLWGSRFSRAEKHYQRLVRRRGKRDVAVYFGSSIHEFISHRDLRNRVWDLSVQAWNDALQREKALPHHWLNMAKAHLFSPCIVDSQGKRFNHAQFMTAVFSLVRLLQPQLAYQRHVGILLPSSAAGAMVNMALMLMGKVPINLNYTLRQEALNQSIQKAGIKTVISSEVFLNKLKGRGMDVQSPLEDKLLYAESLVKALRPWQKALRLLEVCLLPQIWLRWRYFQKLQMEDTATILFSSGSEGEPKGIELSHQNILANVRQIAHLLNFKKSDVLLNSLPIFHSFGLTVTTLMPLAEGIPMVSVADPTDMECIGKMCAQHRVSLLFGTSTFFRLYVQHPRLKPSMLNSVRIVIAGAEKLRPEVRDSFKLKFGLEIYEGYGTTETAPVAAVNIPNCLEGETWRELIFQRPGSVGLPLPGTRIQIVDPETLEALPRGSEGLMLIGGPQVMKSYLNDAPRSAEALREWQGLRHYKTGDKGKVDEDGFVHIIDRYSRFAKIGGEMISLGAVEERITQALNEEEYCVATAVEDAKKGESVIVLVKSKRPLAEIQGRIKALALPALMQPQRIFQVEQIPLLGSGKVDFSGVKGLVKSLLR